MWLCTVYGFFSVVSARKANGTINKKAVMVRARSKRHLQNLCTAFGLRYRIRTSRVNDYQYRLIMPKWRWQAIAAKLTEDIDYDNFKQRVKDVANDDVYLGALHDVWAVFSNQLDERWWKFHAGITGRNRSGDWSEDDGDSQLSAVHKLRRRRHPWLLASR